MSFLIRNSRSIFLILAITLALPIPFSLLGGLLWLSPFVFLLTLLSSKAFVLLNLLGLGTLVIIAFKKRFICQYICPLGVVCDHVSKVPGRKRKLPFFKSAHKVLALFALGFAVFGLPVFVVLDPFFIFHISFEPLRTGLNAASAIKLIPLAFIITMNLSFPGSWCSSICPLGGLQVLVADLKTKVSRKRGASSTKSRRLFISALAGLSAGILASPFKKRAGEDAQIRPPSARPENDFYLNCIRCGSCISACPTHILYQQTDAGLLSLLAPAVDFSESYCLPECTNCGDVCPSGALTRFTRSEKSGLIMATATVDYEKCLLTVHKECNQCRQYCEYGAISYQIKDGRMTPIPVFDKEKCVGCAACKIVCPEDAIHIS